MMNTEVRQTITYYDAGNVVFGELMIRRILDVEEGVAPSLKPRGGRLQLKIKNFTCA